MSAASRTTRCSRAAASRWRRRAIRAKGKTFVNGTFADISEPRALELSEIPGIIDDFKRGTENALAAGFDGVEIHGANGYLLDQFAKDGTNKRTDAYGGSIENRAKLMLEVSKAVAAEAGAERTGIRISPVTPANDVSDSNPQPLFDYIVDGLNALKLDLHPRHRRRDRRPARHRAVRLCVACASASSAPTSPTTATISSSPNKVLDGQRGRPDRVRQAVHLQPRPGRAPEEGRAAERVGQDTFYGGGAKGYTDYPTLAAAQAAE